ncbi:hypothetical protein D0B54_15875 [Solimonas sp. K1W22B-7]|uniref:hypothetical protein n=1 Tax=Solimonas sp. K1W22B-7 TaxID=2303331 RepID=UPI000E3374E7|nr:hypothetical protein [Solimonas sp. K1W22B-7]AXQ30057.1 hypothetical protein D0B54_15875 [Solimonas sp. K1W22B-7]
MSTSTEKELPLGTTAHYANMHKWLQRGLFVCLVCLVIEASFSLPFIAVWMGWPTLSLTEVCHEMEKVRFADDSRECQVPHPLFAPSEARGQKTAKDTWGIQPRPHYKKIGFHDLIRFRDERLAREAAAAKLRAAAGAAGAAAAGAAAAPAPPAP